MVDLQKAKEYVGIDWTDAMTDRNAQRALTTATAIAVGAVGPAAQADPRFEELVLIFFDDLYSERGVADKVSASTRRLVADMVLQLRLEYRKGGA